MIFLENGCSRTACVTSSVVAWSENEDLDRVLYVLLIQLLFISNCAALKLSYFALSDKSRIACFCLLVFTAVRYPIKWYGHTAWKFKLFRFAASSHKALAVHQATSARLDNTLSAICWEIQSNHPSNPPGSLYIAASPSRNLKDLNCFANSLDTAIANISSVLWFQDCLIQFHKNLPCADEFIPCSHSCSSVVACTKSIVSSFIHFVSLQSLFVLSNFVPIRAG